MTTKVLLGLSGGMNRPGGGALNIGELLWV